MDWGPFTLGGQWWRLLSSNFMHNDLGHLVGNLLGLWILGKRAEQGLGRWTFLFVFLVSGFVSSLTSVAVHPETGSVGASGAIFGLAGCLISAYGFKGLKLSPESRWKYALLIVWAGYTVIPDSRIIVDDAGHAGGLLAGLVLGALFSAGFTETAKARQRALVGVVALILCGYFAIRHEHHYVVPLKYAIRSLKMGKPDDAILSAKESLREKPDSELANILLASAYFKKEDYANAEPPLRHVLALDPNDERAAVLLASSKFLTGYCEEAHDLASRVIFHKGKRLDSHAPTDTLNIDALKISEAPCDLVGSGDRALSEGKIDFAISLYHQALSSDPGNARAQIGLAKANRARETHNETEVKMH